MASVQPELLPIILRQAKEMVCLKSKSDTELTHSADLFKSFHLRHLILRILRVREPQRIPIVHCYRRAVVYLLDDPEWREKDLITDSFGLAIMFGSVEVYLCAINQQAILAA